MGDHSVNNISSNEARSALIRHLLNDIEALEMMLERGLIEDDIIRIGAEQEFCLVNDNWRPSKRYDEMLEMINDDHFTTELARYNLEINIDPIKLQANCFSQYENTLHNYLNKAAEAGAKIDTRVILAGILPSISKNELQLDYMTPSARYYALNNMMKELRGGNFELSIRGVDELKIQHDSVLFEACNTSFQMHLQIKPNGFVSSYNWAQAISGPVLGICSNSPMLMGRELWSETRIALFQQSIDTRSTSYALKDQQARVTFGDGWSEGSIAEIFKNDIARFKILLSKEIDHDSLADLEQGIAPKLQALNLHNSTVYRWNRACYGVGGGKAHVRIENRYIPSGPTILDEISNFAFWIGLMVGRPEEFDDMPSVMHYNDAKSNFIKAARTGKESVLRWAGKRVSVRDLVIETLLPIAKAGLQKVEIDAADIDKYLGVIEQRAKTHTGSQWTIENYRKLKLLYRRDDALIMMCKAMHENQKSGKPVHEWPPVSKDIKVHESSDFIGHIMNTNIFVVDENDLADLATSVMKWKNIHHLPIENKAGDLCGLLTWTHMKRHREQGGDTHSVLVSDIMTRDVIFVGPETEIKKAIQLMKRNEIGCLPVVHDRQLIGIVTIEDVIPYDHD
jgi:CBS domain-containing protein